MSLYPEYTITAEDLTLLAQGAGLDPNRFYTHTLPAAQGQCLAIDVSPAQARALGEQADRMWAHQEDTQALADMINSPRRDPHHPSRHRWPLLNLARP